MRQPLSRQYKAAAHADEPRGGIVGAATMVVSHEVESYARSVPAHPIEAMRTGRGFGPNTLLATAGEGFLAASVTTRFPIAGWTTVGDDQITAACITAAPPGSRWSEIDLSPGMVVVYGPGAEHTAIDPAGFGYAFVATSRSLLASVAERASVEFRPPGRGEVHVLAPSGKARALGRGLTAVVEAAAAGVDPQDNREDDLIQTLTAALSRTPRSHRVGSQRKVDNRRVVHTSIEYVKAVDRLATIRELCLVTHVSERRLRDAFHQTYGVPPAAFFRTWAMSEARRRLLAADPTGRTVSRVATELGFAHYGRFAGRYRALYGEAPSATLASVPSI